MMCAIPGPRKGAGFRVDRTDEIMRNRERFYEAFAHTGHRVMGRRLRRFTLRHRLWLEVLESPLVGGGECAMTDLELASMVCAIPWQKLDDRVPRLLDKEWWARPLRWYRKWRFALGCLVRRADRQYAGFQAYLMDHGCPPAGYYEQKIEEAEKVPGVLSLVTGLMRGAGMGLEVWGLSPGEGEWYLAGVFMHRGAELPIKTPHDEEFEEGLRRERAGKKKRDLAYDSPPEPKDVILPGESSPLHSV